VTPSNRPIEKWNTEPSFGKDKLYHLMAGMSIPILLALMGAPIAIALLLGFAAGFGKELYDSFGYGNPDIWDMLITFVGVIIAAMFLYLWDRARRRDQQPVGAV